MIGETFISHTYSCDGCGWQVPMEYTRGALGDYVTNKSLREFHRLASTREIERDQFVNTCNTCGTRVTKAVA